LREGGRRNHRRHSDEYKEISVSVHADLPFMLLREITEALAWIWLKSRDACLQSALPQLTAPRLVPFASPIES
jgi:hypothetical protein